MKAFDITATLPTGTTDRILVWAPTAIEAIAKFERDNRRWRIVKVREATEIDPSSYVRGDAE